MQNYQLAPAAIVGAFDYAYVVFAVVWGYILLDDVSRATRRRGLLGADLSFLTSGTSA